MVNNNNEYKSMLLEEDETKQMLINYIESEDYWVIPSFDDFSQQIMTEIEEAFFQGEKNSDFHLLMMNVEGHFIGVGLAKKTRVSAGELALKLNIQKPQPNETVLIMVNPETVEDAQEMVSVFYNWLTT